MEIVIATNNEHKVQEYRELLKNMDIHCHSLKDLNIHFEAEETGKTFHENSFIKANAIAKYTSKTIIADDSGLIIDAYPELLGIYSHRFLKEASYEEKCKEILKRVKNKVRTARFVCSITLLNFQKQPVQFEGICEGIIADEYKGKNGFGYDPIFIPNGYKLTMGELSFDEKNKISHRGIASKQLIQYLNEFLK